MFAFVWHGDIIDHEEGVLVVDFGVELIEGKEIEVVDEAGGEFFMRGAVAHAESEERLVREVQMLVNLVQRRLA